MRVRYEPTGGNRGRDQETTFLFLLLVVPFNVVL